MTVEQCFSPRRLGHVNLWVDDLAPSESFYNEVCGLNVEFTEPDLKATFLGTGHTPHDLGMMETTKGVDRYGRNGLLQLPGSIGLKPGLNHLAWELENEMELVNGWKALTEINYPIDMTVDHQVAHSVYIFDPDGNHNEFYCDTVKDWRSVLKGEMELITSAWDPESAEPFTEGRYDTNPEIRHIAAAPIHPQRITHAVLETSNWDKMIEFYTRVGGLRIIDQSDNVLYLGSRLPEYEFSLVLIKSDVSNYHHASFQLKDDVALENSLKNLKEKGVVIERELNLPWKRSFFLKDCDGLFSEWYVRKPEPINLKNRGGVPLSFAV